MTTEDLVSAPAQPIEDDIQERLERELEEELRAAFDPSQPRDEGGKWVGSGSSLGKMDRAARAKATHVPSTRSSQQAAFKSERLIARVVGGEDTDDSQPMDVVAKVGNRVIGVEVKTILAGKNDKLTMHPSSLARKEAWVRENKASGHTIAVDARGKTPAYYYRSGFGSFRLSSMQRVTLNQLRKLVTQ